MNTTRWYGWTTKEGEPCIFTSVDSECDTSSGANLTITQPFSLPPAMRQTSSELYFNQEVLRASSSLSDLGDPSWWMLLCLGVTWLVNFLCLFQGIKTSGKVVYFTATFPYVIIIILLVRAATLEGAITVLDLSKETYYMYSCDHRVSSTTSSRTGPSWPPSRSGLTQRGRSSSPSVLATPPCPRLPASTGSTRSVSNCFGSRLCDHVKMHNLCLHQNIVFDVFFICIANCLTSFVAGFAIFGTLGYLANLLGQNVEDVVASGPTLAFITYPDLV